MNNVPEKIWMSRFRLSDVQMFSGSNYWIKSSFLPDFVWKISIVEFIQQIVRKNISRQGEFIKVKWWCNTKHQVYLVHSTCELCEHRTKCTQLCMLQYAAQVTQKLARGFTWVQYLVQVPDGARAHMSLLQVLVLDFVHVICGVHCAPKLCSPFEYK